MMPGLTAFLLFWCCRLLFCFAGLFKRVWFVFMHVYFCTYMIFSGVFDSGLDIPIFGAFCCEADSDFVTAILLFCRRFSVCHSGGGACRLFGALVVRLFEFFGDFSACAC